MEQKNTRHNEDRLLAPFHGPALKAMRQTMGYTQEAFAAASGIGPAPGDAGAGLSLHPGQHDRPGK